MDMKRETARLEREKTRKKNKRHTRKGLSFRFVQLELSQDSVVRLMCALLLHLLKSMNHYHTCDTSLIIRETPGNEPQN